MQRRQPGIRGVSPQNLWRMRQFVEAWRGRPKLSALLRELPWTQHLIILGQSKRPEEQEFYLRRCIEERWSSRELERQFRRAVFERTVLSPPKLAPAVIQTHPAATSIFKGSYVDERLRFLEGAHTVKASVVRGQKVLLFDDLYRSRATMNAIAAVLYDEGTATDVYALALTRTRSRA